MKRLIEFIQLLITNIKLAITRTIRQDKRNQFVKLLNHKCCRCYPSSVYEEDWICGCCGYNHKTGKEAPKYNDEDYGF